MIIIDIFITVILILGIPLLILCFCNRWLPVWFCNHFGHWHLEPRMQGFDGCSITGTCPRCDKRVLQDGQGNWF